MTNRALYDDNIALYQGNAALYSSDVVPLPDDPLRIQSFDFSVDVLVNLIWQYNDADNLRALLNNKQRFMNTAHTQFWNDWIRNVFNIDTANDFGLAVWALILDVNLTVDADLVDETREAWGFSANRERFNQGRFPADTSGFVNLTTDQKRIVIRMRYFQLTNNGSVRQINGMLRRVFGNLGQVYVLDNLDMTMTYAFQFTPDASILTILNQYDLLPRPAGVSVNFTTV